MKSFALSRLLPPGAFALMLLICRVGNAGILPEMPMPIIESEAANARWLRKPVSASRSLGPGNTNEWSHHGSGAMTMNPDRTRDGKASVRLISPTKGTTPSKVVGRPFGEAVARLHISNEDWSNDNRLSFWIYPHLPGFKVISMLVKLRNEGATKVPDGYNREGLNFFLLKPDQWNQVVWEIAHLARDKVTGVEFIYRLQGNEPEATNAVCFDIAQVELQRVEPDHFEGWSVAPGRIAYSHSGYHSAAEKVALASDWRETQFRVVSQHANCPVLTKAIQKRPTPMGEVHILDFSEVRVPGVYRLETGSTQTPWFVIGDDAWRESIIKTINLYYCERCGDAISGIHGVCHQDWQARHGTNNIVINGGWHDAGDLSQGLVNTAEAVFAMLELAERLSESGLGTIPSTQPDVNHPGHLEIAARLMHEARWGLAWMLKTRFGDGTRVTWATMDYWTDGIPGTVDDTLGETGNRPFENFVAAAAEARAARLLRRSSDWLAKVAPAEANWMRPSMAMPAETDARLAIRAAREDWQFAMAKMKTPNLELASAGALAGIELFKATGDPQFASNAVELAQVIVNCQQRELPDWKIPLNGFFYTGPDRKRILHYAHRGHEQAPIAALSALCETLGDHPDWMRWYSAIVLHSEYLKRIAEFTDPWRMIPASIYSLDESSDPRFQDQVRNGIQLSERFFLRRFPVWFDFRGNTGTGLTQAKALTRAGGLRKDPACTELAYRQLEWTVGRNPFCQSLMFGEGHDYAPQYTAMSGDMVGSLPVGIQTRENRDAPYWSTANCYNYKEVWVHPSTRWLAIMADLFPVARQTNSTAASSLQFTEVTTDSVDGVITVRAVARGHGRHTVALRFSNLSVDVPEREFDLGAPATNNAPGTRTLTWTARRMAPREPWILVLVPDRNLDARREIWGR